MTQAQAQVKLAAKPVAFSAAVSASFIFFSFPDVLFHFQVSFLH